MRYWNICFEGWNEFALDIGCRYVQEETRFVWQFARNVKRIVWCHKVEEVCKMTSVQSRLALADGLVLNAVAFFEFLSSMTFVLSLCFPLLKYEFWCMQFLFLVCTVNYFMVFIVIGWHKQKNVYCEFSVECDIQKW